MAVIGGAAAGLKAVEKGATVLQLRAPGATARELESECRELVAAARVPVIVSSRCDVALACGAAGVNLPERDIPVADARRLLGARLVGCSVHSTEEAIVAAREGADYVVFGPVWESPTHAGRPGLGLEVLAEVAGAVGVPVLAIGGVDAARARECIGAGAAGFAAIRMFA